MASLRSQYTLLCSLTAPPPEAVDTVPVEQELCCSEKFSSLDCMNRKEMGMSIGKGDGEGDRGGDGDEHRERVWG